MLKKKTTPLKHLKKKKCESGRILAALPRPDIWPEFQPYLGDGGNADSQA